MIAVFKQIVLCVTAASLFGAVLLSLVQQRAQKEIVRIAVGILLILSLLTPLRSVHFPKLSLSQKDMQTQTTDADALYEQALAEEFCRQTEEYLEQQAQQDGLSCTIQVQAQMKENEMTITGVTVRCSSEKETAIVQLLTSQLGIRQEQIQFIGEDDKQ